MRMSFTVDVDCRDGVLVAICTQTQVEDVLRTALRTAGCPASIASKEWDDFVVHQAMEGSGQAAVQKAVYTLSEYQQDHTNELSKALTLVLPLLRAQMAGEKTTEI